MNSKRFAAVVAMPVLLAAAGPALPLNLCAAGNPNTTNVVEATPTGAFVNNGDGTVTHNLTGMTWKQCAQGLSGAGCATGTASTLTWSAALAAAVSDNSAGQSDWRLPNKKELESIVETCGFGPAINATRFPATALFYFWSSSSYGPDATQAWMVNFNDGNTSHDTKTGAGNTHYLRLVRGGQFTGAFDADHPGMLDIDGNGTADALTDGLLITRYLFGLRGAALIQDALGAGAQRTTAAEIEAFIQSILPP